MRRTAASLALLVLAPALAACAGGQGTAREPRHSATSTPTPTADWSSASSGGCGDGFFWASDAAGTRVVQIGVEARDRSTTATTVLTYTLPNKAVLARLETGRDLAGDQCNDVLMGSVTDTQRLVEGTVTITLSPHTRVREGGLTDGTLTATGLVARDGTTFPDLTVTTEMIGFYAG